MAPDGFLATPKPPPSLGIPASSKTVDVRVIDTSCRIIGDLAMFAAPVIQKNSKLDGPSFAFLISHAPSKTHYIFDLGIRKDTQNLSPAIVKRVINSGIFKLDIKYNVSEILDNSDFPVKSKDINGIIWSHQHFDHTGDPSTFPPSTDLIVGPGFKAEYLPAYPTKKDAVILESDFEGRNFREIDMEKEGHGLVIGRCPSMDFFGDGSFYLLHTPGHTVGHLCGLARVTTTPDTFIFMGGDACHYGGEFRPTPYLPLPTNVQPSPFASFAGGCPGALLQRIHPKNSATEPFYQPREGFSHDHDEALSTIGKVEEFDADPNVLVIIAHDGSIWDHMEYFPKTYNHWKETGVKERTRWSWLGDLKETVEAKKRQSEL